MTSDPNREWPQVAADEIAWIDTEQMIEVDRVMVEDLGIALVQMMENAGRNLARLALQLFHPRSVTVYAGTGGNGGGGLVAARHLANAGVAVHVVLTKEAELFDGVIAHQLRIVQRMGTATSLEPVPADLGIDAVIGYSLQGAPRGHAETLIEATAGHSKVLSLDTPSGVDPTTGTCDGVAVSADATLTLALPKHGLRIARQTGRLFVADISVPPDVYAAIGVAAPAPPFELGPIIEIDLERPTYPDSAELIDPRPR